MKQQNFYGLSYSAPAAQWTEALPLGNARLGAMVYGSIHDEILQINEETIWGGTDADRDNPDAYEKLQQAREHIFAGDYDAALKDAEGMLGIPAELESYQPLCDVLIRFHQHGIYRGYRRELDITKALYSQRYFRQADRLEVSPEIRAEAFCSAPANLLVYRWESDYNTAGNYGRNAGLTITMRREAPVILTAEGNTLLLTGQTCEGGVRFAAKLTIATDGVVSPCGDRLSVSDASWFELRLAAASDYRGEDPVKLCETYLFESEEKNFDTLKEEHIADYAALYGRHDFRLYGKEFEGTTDRLLETVKESADARDHLIALWYNYLRYLLICSTRPGSLPSNLQGIWNDNMMAPWNSDFHPNVNLQINYWPVEGANLPECVLPLAEWLKKAAENGKKTAWEHYRAGGWTLHHASNLFGTTAPVDGPWGIWPFGGVWICRNLYEHHLHDPKDLVFLKETFLPLVEGGVRFLLDFLVECPKGIPGEGYLVTCPSHSPENRFLTEDGKVSWLTYGVTMDIEIIRDIFAIYADCCEKAGVCGKYLDEAKKAADRLPPIKVSKRTGGIQEWIDDYEEYEPGHRHVSHLYALHPGGMINRTTPELLDAAEKTLERRLAHHYHGQGWSCGWIANHFARLGRGDRALDMLDMVIADMLLTNLMVDAHGHPQVGDAQASASAVQEMLVRSHDGGITLLPALPARWSDGALRGFRVRGGHLVDLEWRNGTLTEAKLTASVDETTLLRIAEGDAVTVTFVSGKTYDLLELVK